MSLLPSNRVWPFNEQIHPFLKLRIIFFYYKLKYYFYSTCWILFFKDSTSSELSYLWHPYLVPCLYLHWTPFLTHSDSLRLLLCIRMLISTVSPVFFAVFAVLINLLVLKGWPCCSSIHFLNSWRSLFPPSVCVYPLLRRFTLLSVYYYSSCDSEHSWRTLFLLSLVKT